MMRLAGYRAGLIAIGLVSTLSTPAAAQYGGQSAPQMPPSTPNAPSRAQEATAPTAAASRADVLRAAACVAGRDAAAADALLATAPFSGDERERAIRMLRTAQRCLHLDSPIATSAMTFRGAIAETLYETRFPQSAAARTPVTAAAPFFQAANVAGQETAALLTSHYQVAQCTTPAQPQLVRSLLATEPGTPEERTALEALYPAFGACVTRGTQLTLDQGAIRAVLAEDLYRWSVVQRDGPASAWAAPAAPATTATAANPGG